MPKKTIQKLLPDHNKIKQNKTLSIFGDMLHDANLWHLNRRSARGAFAVGLFWAFIPVPFQMLLSAAIAIPFRVNLPLSVALVWITNPLTMAPIFYFNYLVGYLVLGQQKQDFTFQASWQWFVDSLHQPYISSCRYCHRLKSHLVKLLMQVPSLKIKTAWVFKYQTTIR